jgi:hypothetical protein
MSNVGVGVDVEVYRTERSRDRSGLARAAVESRGCALNAFWFASRSHSNATMRWGMTARFIEAVVEMHPRMAADGAEAVILLRDPECRKRVQAV